MSKRELAAARPLPRRLTSGAEAIERPVLCPAPVLLPARRQVRGAARGARLFCCARGGAGWRLSRALVRCCRLRCRCLRGRCLGLRIAIVLGARCRRLLGPCPPPPPPPPPRPPRGRSSPPSPPHGACSLCSVQTSWCPKHVRGKTSCILDQLSQDGRIPPRDKVLRLAHTAMRRAQLVATKVAAVGVLCGVAAVALIVSRCRCCALPRAGAPGARPADGLLALLRRREAARRGHVAGRADWSPGGASCAGSTKQAPPRQAGPGAAPARRVAVSPGRSPSGVAASQRGGAAGWRGQRSPAGARCWAGHPRARCWECPARAGLRWVRWVGACPGQLAPR